MILVWDGIRRRQYRKMAQQSNQTHFSRNRRKDWQLDELKNHQESSRMDFYHTRRMFKTQNYSFGYETQEERISFFFRIMDMMRTLRGCQPN